MNVNDAVKIFETIRNHEHIVVHYDIGDPVNKRMVQICGEFSLEQIKAISIILEHKPEHWE